MDPSGPEPSDGITPPAQPVEHHQAAVSGISGSPAPAEHPTKANEDGNEAAGENAQHAHKALKPRGSNYRIAEGQETATSPLHPTTAGDHMAAAGDQPGAVRNHLAADLQEGEAGESTPNLEGGTRVPAGHLDHGLPAEGLRMHTDAAITEGVTEGVTGAGLSGRAAPTSANASQALNKKVQPLGCQNLTCWGCSGVPELRFAHRPSVYFSPSLFPQLYAQFLSPASKPPLLSLYNQHTGYALYY